MCGTGCVPVCLQGVCVCGVCAPTRCTGVWECVVYLVEVVGWLPQSSLIATLTTTDTLTHQQHLTP